MGFTVLAQKDCTIWVWITRGGTASGFLYLCPTNVDMQILQRPGVRQQGGERGAGRGLLPSLLLVQDASSLRHTYPCSSRRLETGLLIQLHCTAINSFCSPGAGGKLLL